ncbi:conserved hypothetical protein [Burkholderia pseudomallei Pasteur 52237]|nr:conserved hypothetical protein [Burkholderia pseudomallei Pasteur 52237]
MPCKQRLTPTRSRLPATPGARTAMPIARPRRRTGFASSRRRVSPTSPACRRGSPRARATRIRTACFSTCGRRSSCRTNTATTSTCCGIAACCSSRASSARRSARPRC